jgi:hypothetical protein
MIDVIQAQVKSIFAQKIGGTLFFGRPVVIKKFHDEHGMEDWHLHVFAFDEEKPLTVCALESHQENPQIDAPIIVCTERGWYEYTGEFTPEQLGIIIERMYVIHYNEKQNAQFFQKGLHNPKTVLVSGNPKYLTEADMEYNMPYFYPRQMVMDQLQAMFNTDAIRSPVLTDHCLGVYFGDNGDVRMFYKRPLQLTEQEYAEEAQEILDYYWDAFLEYIAFPQSNKDFHEFKKKNQ